MGCYLDIFILLRVWIETANTTFTFIDWKMLVSIAIFLNEVFSLNNYYLILLFFAICTKGLLYMLEKSISLV